MKQLGFISTAVLSMILGATAPVYAQEQHEQREESKAKPAQQEEKKAQPEKAVKHEPAKQEEKPSAQHEKVTAPAQKNARSDAKATQQHAQQSPQPRPQQHAQSAQHAAAGHGRIPADRFQAKFGNEHRFRVSQADYRNRRFQYGGYSFGFVDPWPSNWLYTQDVYVVDIGGVYYLCNATYPGVNLALSFTI
jgi:hypothetical protein